MLFKKKMITITIQLFQFASSSSDFWNQSFIILLAFQFIKKNFGPFLYLKIKSLFFNLHDVIKTVGGANNSMKRKALLVEY